MLLSSSRLPLLRLVLALTPLCALLWILEVDFLDWQGASSRPTPWRNTYTETAEESSMPTNASEQGVLLSIPSFRHHPLHSTAPDSANSTQPPLINAKRCQTIDLNHVEKEFYRPMSCLSRRKIQRILLELVWTLAEVLEGNGIPYWLDSGTLLGSYREKTVIPYDKDADIGISETSYIQLRDNKHDIPSGYELQVFQGKFHRQGTRDAAIPSRFIHKDSGLYVDIFVFLDSTSTPNSFGPVPSICFSGCYRCPRFSTGDTEFKIPREWVYPLQRCSFGGREVLCPAKPELYLDYLYGPAFMTPDSPNEE